MRTEFSAANTESDVEQFFLTPLMTEGHFLGIPETSIRTKESLAVYEIDKGRTRKRYVPDYVIYSEGIPVLIVEAKSPEESLEDAYAESQLYALELNKNFPSETNPARWVLVSNGRELYCGRWDQAKPVCRFQTSEISVGTKALAVLRDHIGWDNLQLVAAKAIVDLLPSEWTLPSEVLGENRVTLAKAGHNSLFEELEPLLRRYFNPRDKEFEDEIIKNAYVNTEEVTKYERNFEDFLRNRIIPASDSAGREIETTKRGAPNFGRKLEVLSSRRQPFMQLVIGGVGAGKTSFLKRYFNYLISDEIKERIVYFRINFNNASEDLSDIRDWVCNSFVECVRDNFAHVVDTRTEEGLLSVFSGEIRDKAGAYSLLRKSSEQNYLERLGNDMLEWMSKPEVFAKNLARCIAGDRALILVVAFDNVDRREREAQLKIFQTGQWFMNMTKSVCIMTIRDETFEVYKDEKPLDAFLKTGNFYIRPPRFVDMVTKRLNLAISNIENLSAKHFTYEIEGIGRVKYPATSLGSYLTAVYVDLFQKKRRITLVLEGLSGKNARRSLEMFSAVLTSAHFDTREFTSAALTAGAHHIQETTLLRALMRTNYLYFKPGHGFVRNIYDFPLSSERPSHFIKFEILRFLVENRKKMGDTRYEGYFSVEYICKRMNGMGFVQSDTISVLSAMLADELIMSEELTLAPVSFNTAVRVRSSGYIHYRILAQRTEYISSCALVTPLSDAKTAERIGRLWHIVDPKTDARGRSKREAAYHFIEYLKDRVTDHATINVGIVEQERPGALMVRFAEEALNFSSDPTQVVESSATQEMEFDRLFAE
ncbi:MAG: type I restriction enzyme HsdR N-terminal domain-containing protein [Rhizobiaceae bacterium]|nr:type I restriction enzyme HsdR N-terminal domain-containing protein [Rhizobiaceae bacterium]